MNRRKAAAPFPPAESSRTPAAGEAEHTKQGFPPGKPRLPGAAGTEDAERREAAAEAIKKKFRALLEKMEISRQEREELEARIERRMIVSDSQLSGANLRYEKLEARSLDYVGKASIARQAIASGSVLELSWTGPSGKTKILGKPETLEKRGGETILTLRQRNQEELLRIPLGKISFLKRIKQSIFGE
jgi:hypothetical protein